MKNYSKLLCAASLFILSMYLCNAQSSLVKPCAIINSLLDIKRLQVDLNINSEDKVTRFIRIVDQSNFFKGCECNYRKTQVTVIKVVPLDFNTGRYIDLAILKVKQEKSNLKLDFFYATSGQNDKYPNLLLGKITFVLSKNNILTTDLQITNIQ